jgi:hypothetical protein
MGNLFASNPLTNINLSDDDDVLNLNLNRQTITWRFSLGKEVYLHYKVEFTTRVVIELVLFKMVLNFSTKSILLPTFNIH